MGCVYICYLLGGQHHSVNSFKYQIQHYMFHDANKSNLEEGVLLNLASVVISLQAISMYLQEIAITEVITYIIILPCMRYYKYVYISLQDTMCVKFTPKQYLKSYECGLLYCNGTELNTDAAVIKSMKDDLKTWLTDVGFKSTITNGGKPKHGICQLVS